MLKRSGVLLSSLALGLALFALPGRADEWNKKTVITVKEPMRIPTLVLQPGKYVMKLADSNANRHIVQVFNEDQSQILATILAIPNERLEPKGETVLELWETPAGAPRALRAWFYPGDNFGQEFAYPKDEATSLTAEVHQKVPELSEEDQAYLASKSQKAETKTETAEAASAPVAPAPETPPPAPEQPAVTDNSAAMPPAESSNQAPAPAPEPAASSESTSSTSTASAPPAESQDQMKAETDHMASTSEQPTKELPKTGSYVPLLGLSGFLAVGAALVLRAGASR